MNPLELVVSAWIVGFACGLFFVWLVNRAGGKRTL